MPPSTVQRRSASSRKSKCKSDGVQPSRSTSQSTNTNHRENGEVCKSNNNEDKESSTPRRGFFWQPPATETAKEKEERLRLKEIDEPTVPSYLAQNNPYILSGHRCHYTTGECFKSVFQIHNETGNIWTHFTYLWILLSLMWYFYRYHLEFSLSHYIIFTIFAVANISVAGCSSVYHTLTGHEEESVFRVALMMDLTGIAVLITACFIPGIYWGMACFPFWRNLYFAMICVLGSVSIATPLLDRHENYVSHNVRTALFTLTTLSGLIPSIHYLFLVPIGYGASTRLPLGGLALMFLQYGLGLGFYLAKFPERWFPGHFDTWLSSHQLWHIGTGNAMLTYYHCVVRMYDIYSSSEVDFPAQC